MTAITWRNYSLETLLQFYLVRTDWNCSYKLYIHVCLQSCTLLDVTRVRNLIDFLMYSYYRSNSVRLALLKACSQRVNWIKLIWTPVRYGVRQREFAISNVNSIIEIRDVQNSLSTNRPSFAAASQVVTLSLVTNEQVAARCVGLTGSTCFRSVQFMCSEQTSSVLA